MSKSKEEEFWITYENYIEIKKYINKRSNERFWEMTGWLGHPPKVEDIDDGDEDIRI